MQLHLNQFSGQREKNKIDKLLRIREAARELFVQKGFDETTTREIAIRAGVGIGTVFTYAENKRDLLFLVANDDLDEVTRKAEASVNEDAACMENLLVVFRQPFTSTPAEFAKFTAEEVVKWGKVVKAAGLKIE